MEASRWRNETIKKELRELLTLAHKLAETPGLTWVEANNAIYGPGGPFVRLFPTKSDRTAFADTKERKEIDTLIDSLPDPPVGPRRREYSWEIQHAHSQVAPRRSRE